MRLLPTDLQSAVREQDAGVQLFMRGRVPAGQRRDSLHSGTLETRISVSHLRTRQQHCHGVRQTGIDGLAGRHIPLPRLCHRYR
jgi:hypothetical protein